MKILKNEQGVVMPFILLVMLVLMITGTVVLNAGVHEQRQVIYQEKSMQAYYLARSGVEAIAHWIADPANDGDTLLNKTTTSAISITGAPGNISLIKVEPNPANPLKELIITATGSAPYGASDQAVQTAALIMTECYGMFDHAIFAINDPPVPSGSDALNLGNNTVVNGDVGTNAVEGIDLENNSTINGTLYHGIPASGDTVAIEGNGTVTSGIEELAYNYDPLPIDYTLFPSVPPYDQPVEILNTAYQFDTQEDGDGVIYKRIRGIDLSGNLIISVMNDGELHLLVEEDVLMSGTCRVETEGNSKLYLYVLGTTVQFNGGNNFNGYIYAPNATFSWAGGGNQTINGCVIANTFAGASSNVVVNYNGGLDLSNSALLGLKNHKKKLWIQ